MSARILLVEDNATNRYLATYLLEQHAFTVTHAANGEEALAAIAAQVPDLVLMDLQMPKMDGFEAARRIKADVQFCNLPLVALTSYAMVGDRDRALAAGFVGYIEKPITTETFAAEVEKHLRPGSPSPQMWKNT